MWLSALTAWFSSVFTALHAGLKTIGAWIATKLYLLVLPVIAVLKLIYDFIVTTINYLHEKFTSLGDGFHVKLALLPDIASFVNFFFPLDTICIVAILLFLVWLACLAVAAALRLAQLVRG